MRLALIGQQEFGNAVFEAFHARGDEVAGVFCAPRRPGTREDPLPESARARGVPVFQHASLRSPGAHEDLRALGADLAVMAYVLQFVPQSFVSIPRLGTIQYHPSLLPRHRGPSSVNWPIILGERETGYTIFRPSDGLDEGLVLHQEAVPIGPDDTLGSVYFERLFPLGVQGLLHVADEVFAGRAQGRVQDESLATYEGWVADGESRVHWSQHVDRVYDLIRGCDPAPGAWTTFGGRSLRLYEARRHPARTFAQVRGRPGEVLGFGAGTVLVAAQGGAIEVARMRLDGGKKIPAPEACEQAGIGVGLSLGED